MYSNFPKKTCSLWDNMENYGTVQLKCDGTRWRMGGELKGKLANGVDSQYSSHYLGTRNQHYYRWCAHIGCQQSTELTPRADLNGGPFRRKTKSCFSACAVTFQTQSTAGQATQDDTVHARCVLGNWGYRCTPRISNIYCTSTTKLAARTHLNVRLYAYFFFCTFISKS
jgi:hypothetical protein